MGCDETQPESCANVVAVLYGFAKVLFVFQGEFRIGACKEWGFCESGSKLTTRDKVSAFPTGPLSTCMADTCPICSGTSLKPYILLCRYPGYFCF